MGDDTSMIPPAPIAPDIPFRNDREDIMALLEARVDPLQEEKMRQKAMQFSLVGAIEKRNVKLIQQLLDDGVNIDAQIMFTKTPLTHSIELKHDEVAMHLLQNGCDPTLSVDHFPYSQPIHLASRENLCHIVEKLLEMNVDTNARDQDRMTPLHIASYYGRIEVVNTLLKHGANVNLCDSCNRTPLHRGVESGSVNIVMTLINSGSDINLVDIKRWTPLHLAIALDHQDIVNILLDNKCRLNIFDINGKSPLSVACDFLSRSNCDVVRATQFNYDARKRDFIQGRYLSLLQRPRVDRERLQTIISLINLGANIDGPQSLLPITIAAKADHADTVYMLLNAGSWIPHRWEPMCSEIQQGLRMGQLSEWMHSQYIVQFSLSWQCKRKIRKILAITYGNLDNGIDELPLPSTLKAFLK